MRSIMSVRTAAATGAVAALASTGLLVIPSAPAQAAASCSRSYVCMWEDTGYNGSRYVKQYKRSGYYDIHGWDGDNEITSVKNHTGKCVRLYANDNHTGKTYTIHKKVRAISNLKEVGFNDQAESYRIYSCR